MNEQAMVAAVLAVMIRREERQQLRVSQADQAHQKAVENTVRARDALDQSRQHESIQQAVLLEDVMACVGPASRLTTYQKGLTALAKAVVERSSEHDEASQTERERHAEWVSAQKDLRLATVRSEKWRLVQAELGANTSGHSFEG